MHHNREGLTDGEKILLRQFIFDCAKKDLLAFNHGEDSERFYKNYVFGQKCEDAMLRIIKYQKWLAKKSGEKFVTEEEFAKFIFMTDVGQLMFLTEMINQLLKILIDPKKIDPKVKPELGKYLRAIYKELDYTNEKIEKLNEVFQLDLRNALHHNDFEFGNDVFTYFIRKKGIVKSKKISTAKEFGKLGKRNLDTVKISINTIGEIYGGGFFETKKST